MFTHLAVRTEYAIVDSIVRIKDLIKKAQADNCTSLGIADLSNMFATVKFYKACVGAGIKPIIGTEVVIGEHADQIAKDHAHSVILYAMNNQGYQNLLALVSKAYTHGLIDDTPILTKADLYAKNDNLIAILTDRSEIGAILKSNHPERATPILSEWQAVFGDRLYLGVKRTNKAGENDFLKNAITQAHPLGIPLMAWGDVRFLEKDDFEAHEARVCIAGKWTLADKNRPRLYSDEQYFKSQDEMTALFADLPTIIDNTNALASRCNVSLRLGENFLPDFPIPEGETLESFFRKVCFDGLMNRLDKLFPKDSRDDTWQSTEQSYIDRLNYELGIIIQMGFIGYFLIVMDFIRWAKDNDIPVGPGRGSGAGSLVAYSLNITDLDPLAYDLLFERFLNPERVSMPDFDIDFCVKGRDRVIDYVAQTYGREAVSQIITFGTMAAKAVVRDVARVQGKSYGLADRISKMIPKLKYDLHTCIYGNDKDGSEKLDRIEELHYLITNPDAPDHEDAKEIWDMAEKLEGITRGVGKHAGGVLIAPGRISDFSPVYVDEEGHRTSQYDKDDVEAVGLVKFDFLGLRNLTVLKAGVDNINERRAKDKLPPLDLDALPLDDMAVYQGVLQTGKTSAVFQLESSGMKKYLKMLRPSNIEDVIAMCALYRPGPLESGMVTDFIDRKHGIQEVAYPDHDFQHSSLETPLKNTYGVIVYQEQVMQIAQVLSGYSLGEADMLRRAMGKKKPEEMAKQRQGFVDGAINNGVDGELAGKIFDLVEKFAGYGFNKSHSAAYGVLAYQTAYLKHYYPADFMAAVLTSEMRNIDAVVFAIADCKDNFGLEVLPPSVNHSQWHFVAKDTKTIIYGLGAVKGVGEGAVESIVNARADGEFKDLYDFCIRVDIKKVGKLALEALINSGSLDDLAKHIRPDLAQADYHQIRAGLWGQLPSAMKAAEQNRQNEEIGTFDLFAEVDNALVVAPPLSGVIWGARERLNREHTTLGLYLTGHPIDEYRAELKNYTKVHQLSELTSTGYKEYLWFAGLIVDVANFGTRIAVTIDDGTARIEMSCYPETHQTLKDTLKIGEIIVVKGSVRESEDGDRIFVRLIHALSLTNARLRFVDALNVKLHKDDTQTLTALTSILKERQPQATRAIYDEDGNLTSDGCLPLALYLYDDFGIAKIATNDRFRLVPSDQNLSFLKGVLGQNFVISF